MRAFAAALLTFAILATFAEGGTNVFQQSNEQKGRSLSQVVVASNATPFRFTYPAHFPRPSLPLDNPLTEEGVALGQELFHDKRLSGNGTQACASCHQAAHGFAEPRAVSVGAEGTLGTRNSMPLMNLAWKAKFFWDGRAAPLRTQVLMPIEDPAEMNAKLGDVLARLKAGEYAPKFRAAFGTPEISADRLARALEQFLLTLVAGNAKFDQVIRGGAKLTDEEQRGFELFHTEYDPRRGQFGADCFHCHGGPLFQNVDFANNGVEGGPGRASITAQTADEGRFAVPSLRNVTRTAPYMHDGRFATLEQVIRFYDHGVRPRRNLDPNLLKHLPRGLQLSQDDQRALLSFLKTLEEPEISEKPDVDVSAIAAEGKQNQR
jgi:cytochrome c peroxidase